MSGCIGLLGLPKQSSTHRGLDQPELSQSLTVWGLDSKIKVSAGLEPSEAVREKLLHASPLASSGFWQSRVHWL